MSTPSRRRREGRNAFSGHRHEASMLCPYKNEFAKKDWMDGWNEAADDHEDRQDRQLNKFWECEFYQGFKENDEDEQCTHPDVQNNGGWCEKEHCPKIKR